ncbi:glycosyltransferase family 9 protein [Acetobacter oeni]|uniref:Glycosyl transferase n=1 Tax=Acetobacter oeni TaxID=304077 RepID=A0A511XLB8_9PROT|nr:glycosyltransferase family 9 protein [Acetobacter oeni]MBB3883524.1 ADP-heptose:LPS heptosyltransferase [Acetobacter oeni]NHO19563.1 ADP-heptose--LPS heptosyltransferase [Acetobacter oeni]GBR03118.1 lipopolysaccharide heptosyltransferase [Acetobacter oeni LMG 21952]GEN63745.1 glycosyl transferase [Acetobacter oeni]
MNRHILVIKLGALGDFVQAFPAFQAIRTHHPHARITLLTTRAFAGLGEASPWFDAIEVDERPKITNRRGMRHLKDQLSGFDLIYDLQTSARSTWYYRFAGHRMWSGIAGQAALPHANPWRDQMHTRTRQRDQLRMAGIPEVPDADLSWLVEAGPVIAEPYALLFPGAAPHRPGKRWPAERYAELACELSRRGVLPVISGSREDGELASVIRAGCPGALDLTGQTTLPELGGVCARACLAIGNDTGPMHLAAAMGCRAITLFSGESDPSLTAPSGRTAGQVRVIRVNDMATLSVDRVVSALG